jgi:hypothetical protein
MNAIGIGNTSIGRAASPAAGNQDNSIVIGENATCSASNKVRVGNVVATVIEGQVDWSFPSDARFKYNVQDDNIPGLEFVGRLRPVTYQFDRLKFETHLLQNFPDSLRSQRLADLEAARAPEAIQTGFLAQEIEQVCNELGYQFSGLHTPESDVDNYSLAYGSFVPLLVKAIQEQQTLIESLQRSNQELSARLTSIETLLNTISKTE